MAQFSKCDSSKNIMQVENILQSPWFIKAVTNNCKKKIKLVFTKYKKQTNKQKPEY